MKVLIKCRDYIESPGQCLAFYAFKTGFCGHKVMVRDCRTWPKLLFVMCDCLREFSVCLSGKLGHGYIVSQITDGYISVQEG